MSEKTISIKVEEQLHRDIKARADMQGLNLKDYLVKLLENDVYKFKQS